MHVFVCVCVFELVCEAVSEPLLPLLAGNAAYQRTMAMVSYSIGNSRALGGDFSESLNASATATATYARFVVDSVSRVVFASTTWELSMLISTSS